MDSAIEQQGRWCGEWDVHERQDVDSREPPPKGPSPLGPVTSLGDLVKGGVGPRGSGAKGDVSGMFYRAAPGLKWGGSWRVSWTRNRVS